jgi:Mn-dependent DtxR family transcriptional regulator
MGKKYMRQHIHEYLKTMIYRSIVNSKDGIAEEDIKKKLSVTENSEEFDACMKELEDDSLIEYDGRKGVWRAA